MKKPTILVFGILLTVIATAQIQHESKSVPAKPQAGISDIAIKDDINIFFWQDFDSGLMPPPGWTLVAGTTPQTWQTGTSDVYPPYSGDYFALCRYDDTYVPEGQDERLLTEVFSMQGLSDATLSFRFMFSRYWGITPYNNYDLQVLISTDGGMNFNDTIWTELSTDTSAWSSWEWVRAEIDLTPYVTQPDIQLCFRYVGFDGADAAIDNIEISFITDVHEIMTRSLNLYPNPASDMICIEGSANSTVAFYDISGRYIMSKAMSSNDNQIDISFLRPGKYSAVITSNENKKQTAVSFIKQ